MNNKIIKGNFKKYEEVSIEDSIKSDDYYFLALEVIEVGNYEKAKEYLKESLKLNPNNGDTKFYLLLIGRYSNRDLALKVEKILEEEREYLEQVHNITEENEEGNYWGLMETRPYMRMLSFLMNQYDELGYTNKKMKVMEKILKINHSDNFGISDLYVSDLLMGGKYSKAKRYLENDRLKRVQKIIPDYEFNEIENYVMLCYYALKCQDDKLLSIFNKLDLTTQQYLSNKSKYKHNSEFSNHILMLESVNYELKKVSVRLKKVLKDNDIVL